MRRPLVALMTLTAAATASALLAACASNSEGGNTSAASVSATKAADLAALVPAVIKSSGKLTVGTDASYAPNEFKDSSGKIVGFDIDLTNAIATKLGLKASFEDAQFDGLVAAVKGGKYDLGVSSFTDTKDREQSVDFVTYFNAGSQWAAVTGKTVDPDNACGLKVAVETGTVQVDDATARSAKCTGAGKAAIEVDKYDTQDQVNTAVELGKDDAMIADSPVAAYAVQQSAGKLALAGSIYDSAPYGIAIGKDQGTLKTAVQKALQALMDDGTYKTICTHWGVQGGAVTTASINGAQS